MARTPLAGEQLPNRPSREYLRKLAKRLARSRKIRLARAQWQVARAYAFASWPALMRAVDERARPRRSELSAAAAAADVTGVRELLSRGAPVDGEPYETDSPLYLACDSQADAADRLEVARILIDAGAFTRRSCEGGATPLHAAARRGPAAMVELLLREGALFWQPDAKGRRPVDYAREAAPEERERILWMLSEGPKYDDPLFTEAVDALHAGDAARLAALLDAHPRLLRERAVEPDFGAAGYFSSPKLFWFVANNPTRVPELPPNIVEIAQLMIERGVDQSDLDYALELVMSSGGMDIDMQVRLTGALVSAGARVTSRAIYVALGHRQTSPVQYLVEQGKPVTAAVAAGLGRLEDLSAALAGATDEEKAGALATAVVNHEREAARLCLEAGADANRFMPCHSHSVPLHQAAIDGDVEMMELLVAHGARHDIEDRLWRGTPLGWAIHGGKAEAEAFLRALNQRE